MTMTKLEAASSTGRTNGNGHGATEQPARELLLNVALDLFSRKGYADTSVREIVGGAGVTPPTLYYHFMNKEGLYSYLVSECFKKFHDALGKANTATGGAAERLTALVKAHFEFVRHNGPAARFLYGALYGPREQAAFVDLAALMKKASEPVKAAIDAPGAGLRGHDADDLAVSFTGIINQWIQVHLTSPDHLTGRRAEQIVDLFLGGAGGARKK